LKIIIVRTYLIINMYIKSHWYFKKNISFYAVFTYLILGTLQSDLQLTIIILFRLDLVFKMYNLYNTQHFFLKFYIKYAGYHKNIVLYVTMLMN